MPLRPVVHLEQLSMSRHKIRYQVCGWPLATVQAEIRLYSETPGVMFPILRRDCISHPNILGNPVMAASPNILPFALSDEKSLIQSLAISYLILD